MSQWSALSRLGYLGIAATALTRLLSSAALAQSEENSDLAEQAQNPAADMISLLFKNNLSIRPVTPIKLNEDWNLITGWTVPVGGGLGRVFNPQAVGQRTGGGRLHCDSSLRLPRLAVARAGPIAFPQVAEAGEAAHPARFAAL
jgi:hypothetical protein